MWLVIAAPILIKMSRCLACIQNTEKKGALQVTKIIILVDVKGDASKHIIFVAH
jgi:hypothetical protein